MSQWKQDRNNPKAPYLRAKTVAFMAAAFVLSNVGASSFAHAEIIPLDPGRSVSIGLESETYAVPTVSGQSSFYPALTLQVQGTKESDLFELTGRAEGMILFTSGSPYGIEAPEVYIGTPKDQPVHLRIGRKLETWSRLDDEWQLGIIQPRFRWDDLNPESTALSGLFLDLDVPGFRVLGFWSPLYIPERGMPIDQKNGGLSSADPFFGGPSRDASIFGTTTPVDYTLAVPDTGQVISQKSFGGMVQVGEKEGLFGSAAYAYKPMNQLLLAYSGYLSQSPDSQVVEATIYPNVVYHHVADVDAGYRSKNFDVWVSVLDDNPDAIPSSDTLNYQEVTHSTAEALTMTYRPEPTKNLIEPTKFDVSYLHQTGGNAPDQGPQSTGTGSVFDYRYPYQNAVQGTVAAKLSTSLGLSASTKLIYDIGHDGTIWSTDVTLRTRNNWIFRVGGDVLSSAEDVAAQDFISRYRANDRLFTGVSYVF